MFFAPWCLHSQEARPGFEAAATDSPLAIDTVFAAINCDHYPTTCTHHHIEGLPTFRLLSQQRARAGGELLYEYTGARSKEGFLQFLTDPLEEQMAPEATSDDRLFHATAVDDMIVDDNGSGVASFAGCQEGADQCNSAEKQAHFVKILGQEEGAVTFQKFVNANDRTFVMFHAPWCPHSKLSREPFIQLSTELFARGNDLGFAAAVDCDANLDLCYKCNVTGLPAFKFFKHKDYSSGVGGANGEQSFDVIEYISSRTIKGFLSFMTDPYSPVPIHDDL
mmetsp:Transcript_529/g.998  ORF Transcript_529/g.998 Transcript_529/m.998 type:complete len:279 (+) Transcript_529:230-1066(+)